MWIFSNETPFYRQVQLAYQDLQSNPPSLLEYPIGLVRFTVTSEMLILNRLMTNVPVEPRWGSPDEMLPQPGISCRAIKLESLRDSSSIPYILFPYFLIPHSSFLILHSSFLIASANAPPPDHASYTTCIVLHHTPESDLTCFRVESDCQDISSNEWDHQK